jgi:hypothetical protein
LLCPRCQSENCRRSRRQGFGDFAISVVGLRPWRCRSCDARFVARAVAIKYLPYVHCTMCGNLDLQTISAEYVDGMLAWLFRMVHIPAYRCAPCRNRFFSIRRYHRIIPAAEPSAPQQEQEQEHVHHTPVAR